MTVVVVAVLDGSLYLQMSYLMVLPMPNATKLTTKGQVILPAAIRKRQHWNAGTRLIVKETADGVLLKPAPVFPATGAEKVFGSLRYRGKPKTLDEMQAGIAVEARRGMLAVDANVVVR